ncbi:unnamed protein product, partial [Mycena citricolor]
SCRNPRRSGEDSSPMEDFGHRRKLGTQMRYRSSGTDKHPSDAPSVHLIHS